MAEFISAEFAGEGGDQGSRQGEAALDAILFREVVNDPLDDSRQEEGQAVPGLGASKRCACRDQPAGKVAELLLQSLVDQLFVEAALVCSHAETLP